MNIRDRLVDNWTRAWRWWSVQLHLAATVLLSIYALVPSVPPEVATLIPAPWRAILLAAWAVGGIAIRVIKQPRHD